MIVFRILVLIKKRKIFFLYFFVWREKEKGFFCCEDRKKDDFSVFFVFEREKEKDYFFCLLLIWFGVGNQGCVPGIDLISGRTPNKNYTNPKNIGSH